MMASSAWALLAVPFLIPLLFRPLKWVLRIAVRSCVGLLLLMLWSMIGVPPFLSLGVNLLNALILGVLGLPGFGLLLLLRWLCPL